MTDDNACTIHWVKQSHVLRHFSYCFFGKCVDQEQVVHSALCDRVALILTMVNDSERS